MAEYRYYLIPDFMSHVFPQQFEEQAPTEFFSNTADLMKRYKQLREMPYNNEYTWNERTNLPYPRLTVGIDRRDPDGTVTIMQVRNGVNYLCDDYRGPFADRNDKQLIEMAKQLVTAVGVDRIRPHYYTEENGHTKVHVGKDIHITEWANAPELCSALRFSRFLNRDEQQLFQVRNGQRIIENYADGSQLVKDVQTVDETHFYVGSRFCHIQQYANQCFKRGCYIEPEHPQPGDKLDRLLIYQIPHYTCEYRFTDYDYAQNKLKATDYRCAYVANMPRDYTPDKCFRDFNYDDRPCANSMPSLSVSDLIVMERGDKAEALYVDAVGFKDVSRLLPELHDMEVERQEHNLVAVLIQLGGISGPSVVDHLGLHSTGVRPVQANVVSLLVVVQDAADQVGCAVRVDDGDIILATEIVDRLACTGVNGVDDDQIIAALGQRGGDGVGLGGLVALAVEGVDYDVILCAIVLKTFTDVGGKGVGVLIHKESNLQLLALGGSALCGALRSGGALGCHRGSSGSRGTAGGQAQDHTAGQCKANQFFHDVFSFLLVNFLRFSPAFSSVRTFLHVR